MAKNTVEESRKVAKEVYGHGEGALSEAAGVALEKWARRVGIMRPRVVGFSATDTICGLLRGVPFDSVSLQHFGTKRLGKY